MVSTAVHSIVKQTSVLFNRIYTVYYATWHHRCQCHQ